MTTFASNLAYLMRWFNNDQTAVCQLLWDVLDDDKPELPDALIAAACRMTDGDNDGYQTLERLARYSRDLAVIFADMIEACPTCFSDTDVCDCPAA